MVVGFFRPVCVRGLIVLFILFALLPLSVFALTRDEFLGHLKELRQRELALKAEGKGEEASRALQERLGYLVQSAREASALPPPGSHADLIQQVRLAAAVSVKISNAQEEGEPPPGASELRSALSGAAKSWIEDVEIGELKRYPREGSWGGYFVGKLKNFRAVVEAGYEADLLNDQDKQRLNDLVLPVNEDFFQQKFRKEIERIKAAPFQEASYKNIRAYLSALDELAREIPEMTALSRPFLKARTDEFLALLESLSAPLEKELLRSEGNAYLQDSRAHEEFKESSDYQKEAAAVGAYQRWEQAAGAAQGDPLQSKIVALFLLQAKKPYLELYAKWYEANRMGAKRKGGDASDKGEGGGRQDSPARLGSIRVRGAELMDDPKTAGMMEKLRDESKRKEEGRREAIAWAESSISDIQRKADSGDEGALKDSKKVLDFAWAYLREDLPKVEGGLRKGNRALFEQAKAKQDIPAMLMAAEHHQGLGSDEKARGEQKKLKEDVQSAILARYESAVEAGDLGEMARAVSYAESGRLPKEEFKIRADSERYRKDLAGIVGKRYDEVKKSENLAEMYKFVELGKGKADWPVSGALFIQDALAINAKKLENAIRLRNPVLVQAAYDRAKDERLAAHSEASRQRKEAMRFLERKDMAPPDTLDSDSGRNDQAASDAAGEEEPQESQELARYESVPEHPITGSPRGYPKIKGLPSKPPSDVLRGRKAIGFEETVNLRLNDHWGKVDTELKWVHSQSVSASGALKYDVVRVWYLAEKGPETKTADDKSLAASKYEKLLLGSYPQAFAWESALAQVQQYNMAASAEGMETAKGAIQQVHNDRFKPEVWKKGVEELRRFLLSKDDAISRLVEEQLLPLTRQGVIVTLETYDNAVRTAVDGFLKTKPKGMPDFLALAGFDVRRMADEELARRRESRRRAPKEQPPEDACARAIWNARKAIPLNASEVEVDSLKREMNQALDEAAKSKDLKGFADKLEPQIQKWESLYKRALKSFYGPMTIQCSRRAGGNEYYLNTIDLKSGGDTIKEAVGSTTLFEGRKPAEKGWAAGDPNEPIVRHLINTLNAVMAKQETVLGPVIKEVGKGKDSVAKEVWETVEPLAEGRRAAEKIRRPRGPPGPKGEKKWEGGEKEEAPKSENSEERIAELQTRTSRLEFEAKEAEEKVEVIREVRPKLALAAKADAARKESLAKVQDLDKKLEGLDRILKADGRPKKLAEENWLPWGFGVSTAYDLGLTKSEVESAQIGIGQAEAAVKMQAGIDQVATGKDVPAAEEIPFQELAEETDKKTDTLFQIVIEAPKIKQKLEDRLAWEKHFQTYTAEYRDAIREARWQNKLGRQVRPKEKILEDPRIKERIESLEYASARRELENLGQEYASARKETEDNIQFIAREEKRKEGCSTPALQETVVKQFKSYETGDSSEFMRQVSSRFRGLDRMGLGLGRAGLEKSIADDLRNLSGIQFDVAVDPPQQGLSNSYRLPMTWAIRARLGATGEEWIAKTQRSTLHYECDLEAETPGFLLASIEGENIFGRSNYAGVTVVDKGAVDGQTLSSPQAVVNGNMTTDASVMVGFSGVAGTPGSTVGGSVSLTEVLPNAAFVGSQTSLKIYGTGFTAGPSLAVEFAQGAANACAFRVTGLTIVNDKELNLTLTLDPDALGVSGTTQSGTVGVKVTNGNGATATLSPAFIVSAPRIASVSPTSLSFSSSTQVTITGTNLLSSFTYGFLSTDPLTTVANVSRVSDTTLTATLEGLSASGSYSLYLSAAGAAAVCSPTNIQGGVTLLEAGRVDYEVNP